MTRPRLAMRAFSVVVFAATVGSACTAVVGDGDYKVVPDKCGVSIPVPGCADCFTAHCHDQCDLCTADQPCIGAWNCSLLCAGDQTCTTGCVLGLNSGSQTLITSMAKCFTDHCTTACTPPTGTGIGDACTSNAGCASNTCAGSSAWCTETCSASNAKCAGTGTDGVNEYGFSNWCIENSNNAFTCFPGCSSNSDCVQYPGTTCQPAKDATGFATTICSK
ncbi:MAG TPA: hypothetical protein VIF15_22205 [Polyangiaceae bacterium]|jgi:hypothetical protein